MPSMPLAGIQVIAYFSIPKAPTRMLSTGSLFVLASQIFAVIIHSLAKFLATTGK